MVEMALASGLNSMGIHVLLVGPLPTPAIGFSNKKYACTSRCCNFSLSQSVL